MKRKSAVYTMTSCALMAAVMCVLCPMSVPIGPVSITLQILVILLTTYIFGAKRALISYIVYVLLGAMGMPVFSDFQAGLDKVVGPTGGYLVGFVPMILISGFFLRRFRRNRWMTMVGMILGIAVDYAFGTAWFVFQTHSGVGYALSVCVYPFIPFDLGKMVIAVVFGELVRKALTKAGLLRD